MVTYEQAMVALRKADEAGNVEDAKRLAGIANNLKSQKSSNPMSFANKAIAETVGAPVDVVTAGLNLIPGVDIKKPFGGSESIKSGMESVGIDVADRQAETIPEHIGTTVGEVASFILPMGYGTKLLSKTSGIAGNVARGVMATMVRHPYMTIASETTGGIGAGVGRGLTQDAESPLIKSAAEVTGGVIGGLTPAVAIHSPTTYAIKGIKHVARKISGSLSEQGSRYRAGKFIKKQVPMAEATLKELDAEAITNLPPAVKANEKRITALYKSLLDKDPVLEAEAVEQISESITQLEKELRKMGYGAPDALTAVTEKRIAALELAMDKRTVDAMDNAQRRLEKIPVANRKSAESQIVRDELNKVMTEERKKVSKMWENVSKDTVVPFDKTRAKYDSLMADLSEAQSVDIPAPLKRSAIVSDDEITDTTVKEMQGLRSKLLEVSRQSRKDGKWNKARIADEVADAILEDLGAAAIPTTPEGAALKAALGATRHFKTRFESGMPGKILGYSSSGAPAIDPSLTLDISIGRAGARGAVDIDKVVVTPEAIEATEKYLARSFTDYAMDDGAINPAKAERWVKNNEDILDQFSDLRTKLTDATQAQDLANQTKIKMDARKAALRNPKTSIAARYLKASDVNKEIDTIFKSKNPTKTAHELVKMAKQDPAGDAIEGLRAGFVEHILGKAQGGRFNELGQRTVSGNAMLDYISKHETTLQQAFSGEQMKRMKVIAKEFAKIEKFESVRAGRGEIALDDFASNTLQLFGRIVGAKVGGLAGASSPGGSLQLAQIASGRFKNFMNYFSKNHAERMVIDAMVSKDPELLKTLLMPIGKPGTKGFKHNIEIITNRMNVWLAGAGKNVYDDVMSEPKEQQLKKQIKEK